MEACDVDFSRAREIIRAKGFGRDFDTRRKIQKHLSEGVERRSLRASGRGGQLNIRCREETKATAQRLAKEQGLTMADWFEVLVEEDAARHAGGDDA